MLTLQPMSPEDYQLFLKLSVDQYALEKVKAGIWSEKEAPSLALKEFQSLLPKGLTTKNEQLTTILTEHETKVGFLWFHIHTDLTGKSAFIYEFMIFAEYRNQGYGTQALFVLEQHAKKLGIQKIGLHVFGHNQIAYKLYQKVGFKATDIDMVKYLNQ